MIQVRIFHSRDIVELEEQLEEYINQVARIPKDRIISISYSHTDHITGVFNGNVVGSIRSYSVLITYWDGLV